MRRSVGLAALAVFFGAASVWAQTQQVNIPFAFHVGAKHLDAGIYVVRVSDPFQGVISLASTSTREGKALATTSPDQRQGGDITKLVFNKYGDTDYFLSQVWDPRSPDSLKLPQSGHELVTSRMIANAAPPVQVTLAAVRRP